MKKIMMLLLAIAVLVISVATADAAATKQYKSGHWKKEKGVVSVCSAGNQWTVVDKQRVVWTTKSMRVSTAKMDVTCSKESLHKFSPLSGGIHIELNYGEWVVLDNDYFVLCKK